MRVLTHSESRPCGTKDNTLASMCQEKAKAARQDGTVTISFAQVLYKRYQESVCMDGSRCF